MNTFLMISNCVFKILILILLSIFVISTLYIAIKIKDPVENLINDTKNIINFHNRTIYNLETEIADKIKSIYNIILSHNESIHNLELEIANKINDTYGIFLSHNITVSNIEKMMHSDLQSLSDVMNILNKLLTSFDSNYNNNVITAKVLDIINVMQRITNELNPSMLQLDIHTIACDMNIMLNKTNIC